MCLTDFPNKLDRKLHSVLLNRLHWCLWAKFPATILPGTAAHIAELPFHPSARVKEIKTSLDCLTVD